MRTENEWYALLRGFYNNLCAIGSFGDNPSIAKVELDHIKKGMKEILETQGKQP